jgi:hypothetical protein
MNWTRIAAAVVSIVALAAGLVGVLVLSNGVLATTAPAWTADLHWAGRTIEVSIPGLIRLVTAPGVAYLADGVSFLTAIGRIELRREAGALVATCAPCRVEHAALVSTPLAVRSVGLGAERSGASIKGWLSIDGVRVEYSAELAADSVRLRWQLPPIEVARVYHAFRSIVPEARSARIEGLVEAHGQLEVPRRTAAVEFNVTGLGVGGLGTEALQFGRFTMQCREADGSVQRIVNGDTEMRWVPLDRMGAFLPAAVIAAEDQRFQFHAGYDRIEVAPLLARLDDSGPRRGASTLTQQLARTLYTGGEKSVARKLRELLYAIEMERTLGKARILELYLNTADWGPGLCGARAAVHTYFRKRPIQLTPLEAAWLASILRAPHSAYELQFRAGHPDRERTRRILMQVRLLSKTERALWSRRHLRFASVPAPTRTADAENSAHRDANRHAPIAEATTETTESPGDARLTVGAATVVR